MISPIPFWPSFEPCAKLTPVQVDTSTARIQRGGGRSPGGGSYNSGFWTVLLSSRSRTADRVNPIKGESRSDRPTSPALLQLIPAPKA